LGLEPYYVQKSLTDVRKGRAGDRTYHWAKDLGVPAEDFHFDPNRQAAVLVDVDHYIDMPTMLARFPGTYLITTFQPSAAAKSDGEYTFRFQPDGKVHYRVSGGAEYEHHVWDYKGDTIVAEDRGYATKTVVAYHIDRKRVDDHHVLILLSVVGKFVIPLPLPTSLFIEGARLGRLEPVFGDYVVFDIVSQDGLSRSIAVQGDHEAVTLPKSQFDAIHAVALAAKSAMTPSMVASNIAPSGPSGLPTSKLPPGHAAILAGYLRTTVPVAPPVVYPPSASMEPISYSKDDYTAPVPLAGFGSPLIGPCYSHAASLTSEDRCIEGRVERFADLSEKTMPPTLANYMQEFAERLIPVAHMGHPVDEDEVRARQEKPSQRQILEEASVMGDNVKPAWKAFNKKETYTKVTEPRNISQSKPTTKLAYSKYIYSFVDGVMKNQEWYAFNKTPAEIAERMCEILKDASHATLADGSRFDGHVGWFLRVFERTCAMRYFAREHHSALLEQLDAQIGLDSTTTEGRKYQSGYSRGSGSLETSAFNSIDTAFIGYCAWRNTVVGGVKCSPDIAWSMLGLYGGDDSAEGAVDPSALRKSAEMLGQDYDVQVVARGDFGVNFLNRWFGPDVWNGDPNSMANSSRLLSKLWVGPRVLPQPLQRFAERASGYYRMDRNSPVIGEIVTCAYELLGEREDGSMMPWFGRYSAETNWPNEDSGWMLTQFELFIPDFDWDRFRGWIIAIKHSRDPGLLLQAPLCTPLSDTPVVVKQACIVGEQLELPPTPPPEPKGKEEEVSFTESEESSEEEIPSPVSVAAESVPKLASKGALQARPPRVREPREAKPPFNWRDVATWPEPVQGKAETAKAFNRRMDAWRKKRAAVAAAIKRK
jgi:hypothetical protein